MDANTVKTIKNIARAIIAVIDVFEGGETMGLLNFAVVACKVVGSVASIVSALSD